MATSFRSRPSTPLSALLPILFFLFVGPSSAATEIVAEVCNKTTNYRYCVNALYSDPRTPNADAYFLAYISFGLAYVNATNTRNHISGLLRSPDLPRRRGPALVTQLQRCRNDYATAVRSFESAYNDLNSETFADLASYSSSGARSADDCRRAFNGSMYRPLLAVRNWDLKRLSEICGVVSKLFT